MEWDEDDSWAMARDQEEVAAQAQGEEEAGDTPPGEGWSRVVDQGVLAVQELGRLSGASRGFRREERVAQTLKEERVRAVAKADAELVEEHLLMEKIKHEAAQSLKEAMAEWDQERRRHRHAVRVQGRQCACAMCWGSDDEEDPFDE